MKIRALMFFLLVITFTFCNKNSHYETPSQGITVDETKTANVRFSLKASVESEFIAYPRIAVSPYRVILYGLSTTRESSGWVTQTYDNSLRFLNRKTFFIGQGPGDVGNNILISIGKGKLMISENSNQRVSIYDNNWNYKTSFRHNLDVDAFEIYEDGNLFITKDIIEKGKKEAVTFITGSIYDFKVRNIFTSDFFIRDKVIGGVRKRLLGDFTTHSWFCKNNRIFILDCGSYRLLKFNEKGKKLKDITVKIKKKKTDQSLMNDYLRDQGYSKYINRFKFRDTVDPTAAMIPLSKGFVVIRRNDYFATCNGYADGDYFSDDLEYIGKVKVPCFYDLLSFYGGVRKNQTGKFTNGFLYLVQERDDKTVIEKWQVFE